MSRLTLCAAALGLILGGGSALAETPSATVVKPAAVTPQKSDAPAKLSADEMAAISGGAEVSVEVLNRQQLTGTTTGNSIEAGSLTSGQVNFSPNALNGFNGVGNFVVNTGANNTLQGAINLTIVTAPPAP